METYTFSRALHLMRYGGKKMRSCGWPPKSYIFIKDNQFVFFVQDLFSGESRQLENNDLYIIPNEFILGSWVEVK